MLNSILKVGFVLLSVGLGTVCLFLSLMVCLMMLSSKVSAWLAKFFPEAAPEVKVSQKAVAGGSDDAVIAAAIAIAKLQN